MKPERWQQVDKLLQAALALDPEDRPAFLDHACKSDPSLRQEIDSLLASHDRAGDFISKPAIEASPSLIAADKADSILQQAIGPYRIVSLLGAGGMGEVYLAQDSRLGRKVALKLLPDYFTADEQRVKRFKQEAQAASALNHPNIITIYDIGEVDERHFMATEYIEGETLRQRTATHKFSLIEALEVAVQAASALAAAHQARIVHRDIKPENIMLRPDGYVKVLDFGLAKLTEPRHLATGTQAPTVARLDTEPGTIVGTANYMSPEQARGQAVDARTDLFSLGAVIYEMVAGRAPFVGETSTDVIVSIIEREPAPLSRYEPDAPQELQRIVSKALAKDREERYQTIKDILIDLRKLREELAFEAKLERSIPPKASIEQAAAVTANQPAAQSRDAAAQTTSSAEYIVGAITRHKLISGVVLGSLIIAVAAIIYFSQSSKQKPIDSLAVLPFTNESGDPNMEYLSDGITESLINSFSQLPQLRVIARTTVFRFKSREADPEKIGRDLGVDAVLTGKVTRRGDSLTVQAELVEVASGSQLWGEQYNRKPADILAVQQDIATNIAEKSRLRLTREEQKRLTKRYTENTEAYQLYLKGRYFLSKRTEEGIKKSIEHFQQAIAIDPNYALAFAGLADSYKTFGGHLGFLSPQEFYPRVKAAAIKALEIDETVAEAHTSLAEYRMYYEWDWPGAEREYKRALELNPNYATAHQEYANYLEGVARLDEAIAERKRAAELDPLIPFTVADVGYPFYYARQHDQAIEHFRRGLELDPNFFWGYLWIGQAYIEKRMYNEAIAEIEKAIALSADNTRTIATLGYAYGVSGKRGEAQKVLDQLKQRSEQSYVSPYFIALVYTGLGDKDQAFEWLEKAYNERHPYLAFFKVEPVFDTLRSDPRFADLLRRIGLSQ